MLLLTTLRKQRVVDFSDLKTSLVYVVSFWPSKATQGDPVSKIKCIALS